jgi:hypothetical protein
MVDTVAAVGPGILVRVEVNKRQWPVDRGMRLEARIGDEMVAALP